jgi:hypothetical protein
MLYQLSYASALVAVSLGEAVILQCSLIFKTRHAHSLKKE